MLNARPWVTGLHVARRAHLLPNIGIRGLHRNAQYTRPNPNALPAVKQPTVTAEDGTKTLRLRQNGERALPLPPLMDPIALEAKERYKEPKALAMEEDKTEFQKALGTNPFGITTSLVHCNNSNVSISPSSRDSNPPMQRYASSIAIPLPPTLQHRLRIRRN